MGSSAKGEQTQLMNGPDKGAGLQALALVSGWVKKPGGLTKAKVRERPKVEAVFIFTIIAYSLIRLPKLLKETPA